jgi:hypothetical protein
MCLRSWSTPCDMSSIVLQLSPVTLPARTLVMGQHSHIYDATTLHMIVLNGGRLRVPSLEEARHLCGHSVTSSETTMFDASTVHVDACGSAGHVTLLVVAQETTFAQLVQEGTRLVAEWQQSHGRRGASHLRMLMADQQQVMPLAAWLADGSSIKSMAANRLYLGATLMGRIHAMASLEAGKQAKQLGESGCVCCLAQGVERDACGFCSNCAGLLIAPIPDGRVAFGSSRGGRPRVSKTCRRCCPTRVYGLTLRHKSGLSLNC